MSYSFPDLSVSICDCITLQTILGPPPIFDLQPPPILDAQILKILGIPQHPSCQIANKTIEFSNSDMILFNSSPFLLGISAVILVLIVFLLIFIFAAYLLVRTNRLKLKTNEKLNRNYLISNSSASDNSTNDHITVTRSDNQLFCQQFYPEHSNSSSNSTASSSASPKSHLNTSFLNEIDPSIPHLVLGSLHFQGARQLVAHSSKLTNSSSSASSSFCDSQSYLIGQQHQRKAFLPIPVSSIDDNHQYECINEVDTNSSQFYFDVDEPRLVLSPVRLVKNVQGYLSCTGCNGGYNQHSGDCPLFIQQQVVNFNRINGNHGDYLNSLIV